MIDHRPTHQRLDHDLHGRVLHGILRYRITTTWLLVWAVIITLLLTR